MEPLFRFIAVRAGEPTAKAAVTLASGSDLQREMDHAARGEQPRTETLRLAQRFAASDRFVASADDVEHGPEMVELHERLVAGRVKEPAKRARRLVEEDGPRVRDSLLAAYLGAREDVEWRELDAMVRVHALAEGGDPERVLSEPIELPTGLAGLRDRPTPTTQFDPDAAVRELQALDQRHSAVVGALAELAAPEPDELVVREPDAERPFADERERKPNPEHESARSGPARRAGEGRTAFLSAAAVRGLSAPTQDALRGLALDVNEQPLAVLQRSLSAEADELMGQMRTLSGELAARPITEITPAIDLGAWLERHQRLYPPVDDPLPGEAPGTAAAPVLPATHGTARPAGVGELQLVRHHLLRYERGELAHVESVLAGEKLSRTVEIAETTETVLTSEDERTELRAEMRTVADAEPPVQAVAPTAGPVTVGPDPRAFARTVTEQASANLTERAKRGSMRRTLNERSERVEHVFDEPAGSARYGAYHRLDKVHQARLFNHGRRLLYDLIVPEPGALFLRALALQRTGAPMPVRPARFTSEAGDIEDRNWAYLAAGHGATGVLPPPPAEQVLAEAFTEKAADPDTKLVFKEHRKLVVPKGYRAGSYRIVADVGDTWTGGTIWVIVGTRAPLAMGQSSSRVEGSLRGETGEIAVTVLAEAAAAVVGVVVEVVCKRDTALAEWQARTRDQILAANQRRLADYEERAASRDAAMRLALQSLSPEQKRAVMQTEVKRSALAVLTGQDFSGFDAMQVDAFGLPQPSPDAVDLLSAYVRFFEQAIEWDLVAWAHFPYFWGRKAGWIERLGLGETDPRFSAFLTAGAARVVLPVRRGYESAVERFMNTGTVPDAKQLVDIGGPLYVPLAAQLGEGASEAEEADGEPWEFRVASELVRARPDGSMPLWKFGQGEWRDSADPGF